VRTNECSCPAATLIAGPCSWYRSGMQVGVRSFLLPSMPSCPEVLTPQLHTAPEPSTSNACLPPAATHCTRTSGCAANPKPVAFISQGVGRCCPHTIPHPNKSVSSRPFPPISSILLLLPFPCTPQGAHAPKAGEEESCGLVGSLWMRLCSAISHAGDGIVWLWACAWMWLCESSHVAL